MDIVQVEGILQSRGFTDYKWLNPQTDIALVHWSRFKCIFGCNGYGKSGTCPPAVPPVDECHKMIREYQHALILHFSFQTQTRDERIRSMDNLLDLEREIFLAGYYKTFLLPYCACVFCEECVAKSVRADCIDKVRARPGADSMGIDIYQTARDAGYSIDVVKTRDTMTNRFAFILID